MNETVICSAISAWFEPKPTQEGNRSVSPAGFWTFTYIRGVGVKWHTSFDYFTDEAANARLLEAMPFPSLIMWEGGTASAITGKYWHCIPEHNVKHGYGGEIHKDRKTAVVLSFLKFANIQVVE